MTRRLAAVVLGVLALAALGIPGSAPAAVPADAVLYTVGDSLTAGFGTPDPTRAYAQVLDDRAFGQDRARARTVGHGGQCLLYTACAYPTTLAATWQAEVLNAVPTPTTVLVEIGTNDLSHALPDADLEAAYTTLVNSAAARGIRVLVATIPPRESSQWQSYWWWGPQRERLNTWIRATFGVDVADFDHALAGSDGWMRPAAGSGDGVHPNTYGHADLAYAVPLARIQGVVSPPATRRSR